MKSSRWTCQIIISLAVFVQGCGVDPADTQVGKQDATSYTNTSNLVPVAVVSPMDTNTQVHVSSLLESAKIPCFIEGSVVYGVLVPKDEVSRATEILKRDAATNKYWIKFSEELNQQNHEISPLRSH